MYDLESLLEYSPLISKVYTVQMRKALCVATVHVSERLVLRQHLFNFKKVIFCNLSAESD